MLRAEERYLRRASAGHTGAPLIRPGRLRIHAEVWAEMLQILQVWRLHKWEKTCTVCWRRGHKGTKAQTQTVDTMGTRIRRSTWEAPGQYQPVSEHMHGKVKNTWSHFSEKLVDFLKNNLIFFGGLELKRLQRPILWKILYLLDTFPWYSDQWTATLRSRSAVCYLYSLTRCGVFPIFGSCF